MMGRKHCSGFTLLEVLIATIILLVGSVSTLALYTRSLSLSGECRSLTLAQCEAQRKMEEICANDYQTIKSSYTNTGALRETPFSVGTQSGTQVSAQILNGTGTVYARELPGTAGPADGLMRIKVVVCYREKNRIFGEDANLNGRLDAGENIIDATNQELDSPCQIETVIVYKEP